jgi:hypothetical protein
VPELLPIDPPPGYTGLAEVFWQLRRRAGGNGMTPGPITDGQLWHWQQLYGVELTPDEVDMIFAMDEAALAAFAEK